MVVEMDANLKKLKEGLYKQIKMSCVKNIDTFIEEATLQFENKVVEPEESMRRYFCVVNSEIINALSLYSPKFINNIKMIFHYSIDENTIRNRLDIDAGALFDLCFFALTGNSCESFERDSIRNFQVEIMKDAINFKTQEAMHKRREIKKEMDELEEQYEKQFAFIQEIVELPSSSCLEKYLRKVKKNNIFEDNSLSSFLNSVFFDIKELFCNDLTMASFQLPLYRNKSDFLRPYCVSAGMCAILFLSYVRDPRIGIWFLNKSYSHMDNVNDLLYSLYHKIHTQSYLLLETTKKTNPARLSDVIVAVSCTMSTLSVGSNDETKDNLISALICFYMKQMSRFFDEDILHKIR